MLLVGGAFLIVKGTMETHHMLEGHEEEHSVGTITFGVAVVQILILDVVFALDSHHHRGRHDRRDLPVMIIAVVIAMLVMLLAANPVGDFVNAHPTVKMLALSFLLLVGVALIADGFYFHIPARLSLLRHRLLGVLELINLQQRLKPSPPPQQPLRRGDSGWATSGKRS